MLAALSYKQFTKPAGSSAPWALLLLAFIFALAAACTQPSSTEQLLAEAEAAIEDAPDSALTLLHGISYDNLLAGSHEQALYDLLSIEALYKLYREDPDSMLPIIGRAEACFRTKGDKHHQERATYYHGMLLFYSKEHTAATLKLKEGLTLAEQLRDSVFMSKYYESITQVNYESRNFTLMLDAAQRFLDFSIKQQDADCIARGLTDVSIAYYYLGDTNTTLLYEEKMLPLLDSIMPQARANILTNIGMSNSQKDEALARRLFKEGIALGKIPGSYAGLGNIEYRNGNRALADSLWRQALKEEQPDRHLRLIRMILSCIVANDLDEQAQVFYKRMRSLEDSLSYSSEQHSLAELQMKYDHQVLANMYLRRENMFKVIILLLTLFSAFFALRQHSNKKILEVELKIKEAKIESDRLLIEELKRQGEAKDAEIENRKELSEVYRAQIESLSLENQSLARKITDMAEKSKNITLAIYENASDGKDVYDNIMQGGVLPPKDEESEAALVFYYSMQKPEMVRQWNEKYQELPMRLRTLLVLTDMGFDKTNIRRILHIESSSLRSLYYRLRQKENA